MKRQVQRLRLVTLEDRSLPSFVTAPSFRTGASDSTVFGSEPLAMVAGDFNRDGKMDLATVNGRGLGLSVLLGNGNGTFRAPLNVAVGKRPSAVATTDLNNDGKLDLIIAQTDDNKIGVLLGNGSGGFAKPVNYNTGNKPIALAIADFNADGKQDIAVANNGSGTVSVFTNAGNGQLGTPTSIIVGPNPTDLVAKDFNHDNKIDIASVGGGFDHMEVNVNMGGGTFAPKFHITTGFNAESIAVGDVNGDTHPDLVVGLAFPSNGMAVHLGSETGAFAPFVEFSTGRQTPADVAIGDVTGDGLADVVTANGQFGNNSVTVMRGDGTGDFSVASMYAAGQGPESIVIADFNRDGVPDLATADRNGTGTISVLIGDGNGTFLATPHLEVASPKNPVVTDFDGDNKPDIAVVSSGITSGVQIFLGVGNGSFEPPSMPILEFSPTSVTARDFNGDDKPDIVLASSGGVGFYAGNGDGTFQSRVNHAAGSSLTWVTSDDVNGDGRYDILVGNSSGVALLLGNGNGTFGAAQTIAAGGAVSYITTGDLNKDGKRDLAVINDSSSQLATLLGNGDGTFAAPNSYPTRTGPGAVGIGDFNNDGKPDLAVTTFFGPPGGGSGLAIWRGAGNGTFTLAGEYSVDSRPRGLAVVDATGDGKPDVVTVNNFDDTIQVFPGLGNGKFAAPLRYIVGDRPEWIVAADFNGNGKADLLVTNGNSNTISIVSDTPPIAQFHLTSQTVAFAGGSVEIIVKAQDAGGRLLPNFTGTVTFASSDPKAILPRAYRFTANDRGIRTFKATLRTAGQNTITVKLGAATGTDSVEILPTTATRIVATTNPSTVAGEPTTVTVSARDRFGNIVPDYRGTIRLTTTDKSTGVVLPADYTFTEADAGQHTFNVILTKAGVQAIYAADTVNRAFKASARLTVVAGQHAGFALFGLPLTVKVNAVRTFYATAVDAYGNTVTNYTGTVQFSNTNGTALLPANYTYQTRERGRHRFTVTFQTAGTDQTLTITDSANSLLTATITGITVV